MYMKCLNCIPLITICRALCIKIMLKKRRKKCPLTD